MVAVLFLVGEGREVPQVWCGVVQCSVVWCSVVWCGAV
jgi:hypothetical protein